MLAAEAGYEKAIYWMSQQYDMLNVRKEHPAQVQEFLEGRL